MYFVSSIIVLIRPVRQSIRVTLVPTIFTICYTIYFGVYIKLYMVKSLIEYYKYDSLHIRSKALKFFRHISVEL